MYYRLIRSCPVLWIVSTFSFSLSLLSWAFYKHGLPSFEDPLVGFEVRDTDLARRLNTWRLLTEATAWNGLLSLYPPNLTQTEQTINSEKFSDLYSELLPTNYHAETINTTSTKKISSLLNDLAVTITTTISPTVSQATTAKPKKKGRPRNKGGKRRNDRRSGKKRSSKAVTTTTTIPTTLQKIIPNLKNSIDTEKSDNSDDNDDAPDRDTDSIPSDPFHSKSHAPSKSFFCGKLLEDYAQFVVEPVSEKSQNSEKTSAAFSTGGKGLLELQSIRDLCTLDSVALRLGGLPFNNNKTTKNNFNKTSKDVNHSEQQQFHFNQYCETRSGEGQCCRSWSVPNYILLLGGKTDCNQITESDVTAFVRLLHTCAPFYADNYLSDDCGIEGRTTCPNVPEHCTAHENLVFTVLHYLVDYRFLDIHRMKVHGQQNANVSQSLSTNSRFNNSTTHKLPHFHLSTTSIFLPMAKSSKLLAYYRAITQLRLTTTLSSPQKLLSALSTTKNITTDKLSTLSSTSKITIQNLQAGSVRVVAADLGCKESLFSEALVSDLALLIISSTIIFGSLLAYTRSVLLTLTALLTNIASLGTAYYLYRSLFGITFFPFLNLLSLIILIGIGSDNALIYCKAWSCVALLVRENSSTFKNGSLSTTGGFQQTIISSSTFTTSSAYQHYHQQQLSVALRHVLTSTFCASLTTCAAFFAGYFTSITSLRCFALFAGIAIACNFIITVITFPASIIVSEKMWFCGISKNENNIKTTFFGIFKKRRGGKSSNSQKPKLLNQWNSTVDACSTFLFQNVILRLVFNYRYLLAIVFLVLATFSSLLVFYLPGLQLPSTAEFQVFSSKHLFEQYDLQYQHEFWFSRFEKNSETVQVPSSNNPSENTPLSDQPQNNIVLPIRIVFGVLPVDNGDHLDPFKRGHLTFDPAFNLSSRQSQEWLLEFCRDLRAQPFFRPTLGPLLTNCFIETFKAWMEERRCLEELGTRIENRFPCCQASTFPYEPEVFDRCLVEVIERLHRTPSYMFSINGKAGPRFEVPMKLWSNQSLPFINFTSKTTFLRVKAVVIEYDSVFDAFTTGRSFKEMATFWKTIDNWLAQQLITAPESLKTGWFVTVNSEFFALQNALSSGVYRSLLVSVGLAFATLILTTANLRLSLLSTVSIACTIFTTIGALVGLLDWRLNVIESITISLTIGLAIDATLHYTIVYKMLAKGNHLLGIQMTLARVGSPVAMGAATTFLAGSVMLFSTILAYIQIGTFLMVLSLVSWLFSTLFHLSLLSIFGTSHIERQSVLSKLKNLWIKMFTSKRLKNGENVENVTDSGHSVSPVETEFLALPPISQPPSSLSESSEYNLKCDIDNFKLSNNNNELNIKLTPSPPNVFLRVTSI